MAEYKEHHFQNVQDVGIAFTSNRIWVCINGSSLLRVKLMPDGQLLIEFTPPPDYLAELHGLTTPAEAD